MKACCPVILACLALGATAHAQAKRVPVFAGNGVVHVLVEVDGTVKTWGDPGVVDPSPSLGDGVKNSPEVKAPRALPGLRDIVDAAVGPTQVLLLKGDGTVLAWGVNNDCEVGTGDEKTRLAPVPVPGLKGVKQIAAGGSVSGGVTTDGSVWLWGSGYGGLLANGKSGREAPCAALPVKVEGLTGVTQLALGDPSLVLKDDGTVWGWGSNKHGELCDGTTTEHLRPFPIAAVTHAVSVVTGNNSLFVLADGTVRMCGRNESGALGDVAGVKAHLTPFQVPGVTGVKSARMNGSTTIVQLADGTLRGWGLGWYGALGDGHGDSFAARPRAPIGLGPVIAHYMETNGSGSFAIRADGTVMTWGFLAPPGGKTEFLLTPVAAGFTVALQ